jgi:putative transposase
MARLARVVIPGHPHHVTQRGNSRARTFFGDADYALWSRSQTGQAWSEAA